MCKLSSQQQSATLTFNYSYFMCGWSKKTSLHMSISTIRENAQKSRIWSKKDTCLKKIIWHGIKQPQWIQKGLKVRLQYHWTRKLWSNRCLRNYSRSKNVSESYQPSKKNQQDVVTKLNSKKLLICLLKHHLKV